MPRSWRRSASRAQHPEGLFFPDTYLFGKGTTDLEILRQARDRMRANSTRRGPAGPTDLPFEHALRGADPGLDRREGNGARQRAAAHRRRVHRAAAHRHAAADRPDGDLRPGHRLRRQPAASRPRARRAVQYLHARGPAADADRAAGRRGAARRGAARTSATNCTSWPPACRTAATSSRARSPQHEAAVQRYLVRYRQQRFGSAEMRGRFITFEGGEGAGKSTQIARAADVAARARRRGGR